MQPGDPRIGRTRVWPIPGKGRGIVAAEPLAQGEIIEENLCIILNVADTRAVEATLLGRYVYAWGQQPDGPMTAVALGNISFCNHSDSPNAYLDYDDAKSVLALRAREPILVGTEITIDYQYDLEFEPID